MTYCIFLQCHLTFAFRTHFQLLLWPLLLVKEIPYICHFPANSFFYSMLLLLRYLYPIIIFFLFKVCMVVSPRQFPWVLSCNLCIVLVALTAVGRMSRAVTITLLTLSCLCLLEAHIIQLRVLCLKFKFREMFSVLVCGGDWRVFEITWFGNQVSKSGQAAIFFCCWVIFQGWIEQINQHTWFFILKSSSPFTCLKGFSKRKHYSAIHQYFQTEL